jgi:endonuclease/exonuclease/phosphatase family metal-dependent hydrolase
LLKNPKRTFEQAKDECVREPRPADAAKKRGTRAMVYGGSYGLLLLSRVAPDESDFLSFESDRVARGAIYARFNTGTRQELSVFCTHLAAHLPGSSSRSSSWEREQLRQIQQLLGWIDAKAPRPSPVAILGDLNCGPELGRTIQARLPNHYARFLAAGFSDPFAQSPAARCTWCSDNRLQGGTSPNGALIDHVLLRDVPPATRAERILDDPVELDYDGARITVSYSDHYGVEVALAPAG